MASKPQQNPLSPQAESEAYIPSVQAGGVSTDSRWALPITSPILLFASPVSWQMIGGEILPRVHQSRITPGINQVDKGGNVGGLIGIQSTWGRVLVPVNTEVEAFGAKCAGYNRRLETRITNAAGGKEYHHCSIWQKPRYLGSSIRWDRDGEGYLKFLRWVKESLLSTEVDPSIREALYEPVLREIASLEPRAVFDPSARAKIDEIKRLYRLDK